MSKDMVYEDVPRISRREGDNLVAGQSNSTILLGRDRMGGVDSGYGTGKGAGAMHLVVGRKTEDPQIGPDAATIYLSAKTDPDAQAGTAGVGKFDDKDKSGIVMRADCVRIVPRTDFKISVGKAYMTISSDGSVVIDGDVQLGADAADRMIRGDKFAVVWSAHVHPTAVGPSGPPQPLPQNVFSPKNKVG
jgi:hypothetical protein